MASYAAPQMKGYRGVRILAPNGAVDRGGTGATGNGQQPECVGVACAG